MIKTERLIVLTHPIPDSQGANAILIKTEKGKGERYQVGRFDSSGLFFPDFYTNKRGAKHMLSEAGRGKRIISMEPLKGTRGVRVDNSAT